MTDVREATAHDLLEAVEALTRVRFERFPVEDGADQWGRAEPRLVQLVEAIHATAVGGGGAGRSLASERFPLSAEAMYRAAVITSQIGDWCRMVGVRPTRDPVRDLDRWHAARLAVHEPHDWYVEQLRGWAREIDGMLSNPGRPIDVTRPCPVCGSASFVNGDGDVCAWPLKATARPPRVECRACGVEWEGVGAAEELAGELDDMPVNESEDGVENEVATR